MEANHVFLRMNQKVQERCPLLNSVFLVTSLVLLTVSSSLLAQPFVPTARALQIPLYGVFYTYAPSIAQVDANTRYIFYCGNAQSRVITDHIMTVKETKSGGTWHESAPLVAFGPYTASGQYNGAPTVHTCDPDVVRGSFIYKGVSYAWAMVYTGEHPYKKPDGSVWNFIGVAFTNSIEPGSAWIVADEPLLDDALQPSIISKGGGKVALFVHGSAWPDMFQEVDLSNADSPTFSPSSPVRISTLGLPNNGWLHNGSYAYDSRRDRYVVSYDSGGSGRDITVASIPASLLTNRTSGRWVVHASIGSDPAVAIAPASNGDPIDLSYAGNPTGRRYNHNSGIVRTPTGSTVSQSSVSVFATGGIDKANAPWWSCDGPSEFRLYEATVPMNFAPTGPASPRLTRVPSSLAISAQWKPAMSRGTAVDYYVLNLYDAASNKFKKGYAIPPTARSFQLPASDLVAGGSYFAYMYAHSSAGFGDPSVRSNIASATNAAAGQPDSPIGPNLSAGKLCSGDKAGISVRWDTPDSNGAPIDYYTVNLWSDSGFTGKAWAVRGVANNFVIPASYLQSGKQYFVFMYTYNGLGWSTAASRSNTIMYTKQ